MRVGWATLNRAVNVKNCEVGEVKVTMAKHFGVIPLRIAYGRAHGGIMKKAKFALVMTVFVLLTASDNTRGAQASGKNSDVAEKAASILDAYEKLGRFDGAVLLATKGEIVFSGAYGMANRDKGIPNTTRTKFSIASLGKAMTAHLALLLVDEGSLVLDRPIAAYLPKLSNDIANKVTLHHLLTHSSGLGWWDKDVPGYETRVFSLAELVTLAERLDLKFEPGTDTFYSNSGYNLVAAVIESVTGKPFTTAMRERIFEPAGMRHTGFAWVDEPDDGWAVGYDRSPAGVYERAAPNLQYYAIGAGGIYSTVEDMFRWTLFLDRTLSPESWSRMFKPHVGNNGYGWRISRYGTKAGTLGKYTLGLGGTFGFASVQSRCLDDEHYIIILSNVRQLDQSAITNDLVNLMVGYDVEPPAN